MAFVGNQVPSSSPSSSSTAQFKYHVFLSFRGGDTRKNFTDHLYTALNQEGIHTFRDDNQLRRGENIELEIQRAIRESKLSIIILSKDYASSRWCLDELAMIMERRKSVGHIVVPVFYDVDRSQVRDQTGSYGKAFVRHEKNFLKSEVEEWRAALTAAADIGGGMVLQDGYESQFIQNIVREVENKLNRTVLNVAPYLVGTDSRIARINRWLQDESDDVEIATIYGLGGIGKTTIAKIVYSQNSSKFKRRSFLANVRERSEQPNGLVRLQRQLLSDLIRRNTKIYNVDEGIMKIKDALRNERVLLVLDDVDDLEQFNAVVGMREWCHPGSKIIITTRHEYLQGVSGIFMRYEVNKLDNKESLQLFSWHTFRQDHPADGYEKLSEDVVNHCGGVPLALQVLGASLSGKTIPVWESALQKLEKIADSKIQQILRISYDSLQDDHDKRLFLDMACFFTRMDMGYVLRVLNGCGFYTLIGIQNLINRCLITISDDHKLLMHQLVRDMGREIVRQESPDDPGERSRLWNPKDAANVLKQNTGTESIKGLILEMPMQTEDKRTTKDVNENHPKLNHIGVSSDESTPLDQKKNSKKRRLSILSKQPVNASQKHSFSTKAFEKMVRLKLLNLNYVELCEDYKEFPRSLVWLCWRGFPLTFLPIDLCLDKLVALDMRNSKLKYLWKEMRFLVELKVLNLGHCHGLVRTPDFRGLPSLEKLVLKDCKNLTDVDESVGGLERLIIFNLKDCKSLKKLPIEITMLHSLEELIISGCSNLVELPKDLAKLQSLKILHADGIAINSPDSITEDFNKLRLSVLHSTSWSWLLQKRWAESTSLSLPSLPRFLVSLSLAGCRISDTAIPGDLSALPSLEYLNLSENPFCFLPESINSLGMLDSLVLDRCTNLKSLPELPTRINSLKAEDCTSLERITNLPNLLKSLNLEIFGCDKLVEVQGLFKLEPVENIDNEILDSMGLTDMKAFKEVEVEMSNALTCTEMKTSVQVLQECGIFSIFLPGNRMPEWFSQTSDSPSISFEVESKPGHKIKGLSLCTIYNDTLEGGGYIDENCVKINNKTTSLRWTYNPTFYGTPKHHEDMLWLSHWTFGDQFEAGDEVHILVEMASGLHVKGCGICLVYEEKNRSGKEIIESSSTSSPGYITMTDTDMAAYELGTDSYFLCHHKFQTHQGSGRYDWDDMSGYEYLFEEMEEDSESEKGMEEDSETEKEMEEDTETEKKMEEDSDTEKEMEEDSETEKEMEEDSETDDWM
ncbi:disease resistance protein RPV1-like [Mercurialis annua]|uniref:disease resistance protein RPV1-like n=1 Tax=Mercurialis annua TaxID=3986 RepID=UPI00215FCFD4|nr:disease resistance protein RPV1-like [Mercurialis annua]